MIIAVGNNNLGPKGAQLLAEALAKNTLLNKLYIGSRAFGIFAVLTRLHVDYNDLGASSAVAMASVLKTNSTLREISLGTSLFINC